MLYISTHTPLAGRDTSLRTGDFAMFAFQLTRPLRGATLRQIIREIFSVISTHTPLAGRDLKKKSIALLQCDFNSHAPCGARRDWCDYKLYCENFNSHAPCGARPRKSFKQNSLTAYFNSHAPCGARPNRAFAFLMSARFQLTRPLRGATTSFRISETGVLDFNSHAPCGARPHSTRR